MPQLSHWRSFVTSAYLSYKKRRSVCNAANPEKGVLADLKDSIVEATKNGPSKFKGSMESVDALIKKAWDEGTVVNNGKPWKVYESEDVIGAAAGKETSYMRVEMTTSTKEVHASPITKTDYAKYTKPKTE